MVRTLFQAEWKLHLQNCKTKIESIEFQEKGNALRTSTEPARFGSIFS
jgi:hypothetical protein